MPKMKGITMADGTVVHISEWLPLYQQVRTGEQVVLQHGATEAVVTAVLVHTTPDYQPPNSEDRWYGRPATDGYGTLWEQTGGRQRPIGHVDVLMDSFDRLKHLEERNATHIYDTAQLVLHLREEVADRQPVELDELAGRAAAVSMWAVAIRAAASSWAMYAQAVLKPYDYNPAMHIKSGEHMIFTHRESAPHNAPADHIPFTHSKQLMLTLIGIAKYEVA